ncbi:MAG: tRNA epoxyqueuosine(34) reductase QueG [Alistipes sp.]|nr:tRNA epoxyqueuosine(34) reductase QueG [Alistipes sp.]
MLDSAYIKDLALGAGFDECGITARRHLAFNEQRFGEWLDRGYASRLDYMHNHLDKRFDVGCLVEGARSVVVCAVAYDGAVGEELRGIDAPKIAAYASRRDYHKVIKKALQQMLKSLQQRYPHLQGRAFVDSAPLLEKQLAVEAGLGWIGRQSLLVTPRFGSYVLLGELVLNDDVDAYDTPYQGVGCGGCRRCVEACPTGAVTNEMVIDTNRCISCHTIEASPESRVNLHGWVFGCDECQMVCPYNRLAESGRGELLPRLFHCKDLSAEEWLSMDEEEFSQRFAPTPLKRAGLKKIQENTKK